VSGVPDGPSVVIRSELIETADEARAYYAARLAGSHDIGCCGQTVTIVFERDATHLYSTEMKGTPCEPELVVRRTIPGGRVEQRKFSVARARLMDHVLRAVSLYTVSIPGTGQRGHEKRMLHGPRLGGGDYLRVVLRPGPGAAWTCVSAYPVNVNVWREACRSRRAKFPP
jgi:hypothetical protein